MGARRGWAVPEEASFQDTAPQSAGPGQSSTEAQLGPHCSPRAHDPRPQNQQRNAMFNFRRINTSKGRKGEINGIK